MTAIIKKFPYIDGITGSMDVTVEGIEGDIPVDGDLHVTGNATVDGYLAVAGSQSIIGVGAPESDAVLTVRAPGLDDITFTDFYGIKILAGNVPGTGFGEFAIPLQIQQVNAEGFSGITFLNSTSTRVGIIGVTNPSYTNTGPDADRFAMWSQIGTTDGEVARLDLGGTNGGGFDFSYLRFSLGASGTILGFGFGTTPPTPRASIAALTNNVTAGGVDDVIANYADLAVYANDAASIRNDIYQLARTLAQVVAALRQHGFVL